MAPVLESGGDMRKGTRLMLFGGARRNAQRAGDIGHFQPFHHAQHENIAAAIGKLEQQGL
jgi:hypothetical protein